MERPAWTRELLQFCYCQLSYFYIISHTKNWLCTANYCNSTLALIFIWGDRRVCNTHVFLFFFYSYADAVFCKFLCKNIFKSLKYIWIVKIQHCYLHDNDYIPYIIPQNYRLISHLCKKHGSIFRDITKQKTAVWNLIKKSLLVIFNRIIQKMYNFMSFLNKKNA